MSDGHGRSAKPLEVLSSVDLPVGGRVKDESEERVERSTDQGEEIAHAGDDFGKDECQDPDA